MLNEPQQEHRWLQRFVGEWTYASDCSMGPDKPPAKFEGTESVRSLGGLWVLCEGRGTMPEGGYATTVLTLGYDPETQGYVGTWVGSMMSHLWIYAGSLDASGNVLTLDTEGPICTGDGNHARYQDVIEFKSPDHRILSSRLQDQDGIWHEFMTAHYRRKP